MIKKPSLVWLLPYRDSLFSNWYARQQSCLRRLPIVFFLVTLLCISSMLMLHSCSRAEYSTPDELHEFVADEDNGLAKSVDLELYSIKITHRPTDLLVHQELDNTTVSNSVIDSLRSKYSRYYYFILSLSANGKEALHQPGQSDAYGDLVQTLSFRMGSYVNLTTSSADTIPVADFMINRTFGLSESTDLLFVFNREKTKGTEWIQFNLYEFGLGVGDQKFRFKTEDLEAVPRLDFLKR
jgi:hypothetical protein